jgi:hypothetical protein
VAAAVTRDNWNMTTLERKIAAIGDDVTAWRLSELLRAGYGWDDAVELAKRRAIDLRLAARLLRDGCAPDLALRILL